MTDNIVEGASKDAPVAEEVVTGKVFNEDDRKLAVKILKQVVPGNNTALGDYTAEQISTTVALLKIEKSEIKAKQEIASFKERLSSYIKGNQSAFNEELEALPGVTELRQKYQANIEQSKLEYVSNLEKVLKVQNQEEQEATRGSDFRIQTNLSMNKWLADNAEVIRSLSEEIRELTKPKQNTDAVNAVDAPVDADTPAQVVAEVSALADDKSVDTVIQPKQDLPGETLPDSVQ